MPSDPPEGYVSSADACAALGISDRTLRRRVQAGTIAGEYVARPQGTILYVKLPEGVAASEAAGDAAPDGEAASEDPNAAEQAAILTALLERLDSKDAALLAATERAARAETERDAAQQAAEAARSDVARLAADLEALRSAPWYERLGWWKRRLDRNTDHDR